VGRVPRSPDGFVGHRDIIFKASPRGLCAGEGLGQGLVSWILGEGVPSFDGVGQCGVGTGPGL
jgi:hypothetical protein